MAMTKRGSVTIEAMIGIFVVLMLTITILSVFHLYTKEDQVGQVVLDSVDYLMAGHYVYERIGITDFLDVSERFPQIQGSLLDQLSEYVLDGLDEFTKEVAIKTYLMKALEQHNLSGEVMLTLSGEWVNIQVSYQHKLPFGKQLGNTLMVSTKLWLYGNGNHDPPSLVDYLQENKVTYVYITKTGHKYHRSGCFYLNRSTTDKDNIKKIALEQAKLKYSPCKRCITKEVVPWK